MKKLKLPKFHWAKLLSIFFFVLLLGSYIKIFAIASPYSPGEILDPLCAPGEENCIVEISGGGSSPWLTSNSNVYYNDGNVGIGTDTPTALLDIKVNSALSYSVNDSGVSGLNDATFSDTYTGSVIPTKMYLYINSTGATDTFSFYIYNQDCPYTSDIAITGSSQLLCDGISVTFASTTGHTQGDTWYYNISSGVVSTNPVFKIGDGANNYFSVNAIVPNSMFLGTEAGVGSSAHNSNFLGYYAGYDAESASNSNFFGYQAGYGANSAQGSNFFGYQAGYGATSASSSNFFGTYAGSGASEAYSSNFLGASAGQSATKAKYSNFLGYYAGLNATNASNSIFIGKSAGDSDIVNNTTNSNDWSILLGYNTKTGGNKNSVLIGGSNSYNPISNTKANQFMLAPTLTEMRLRGVDYTLPTSQGGASTVLTNDGNGGLTWEEVSGGGGSSGLLSDADYNTKGGTDAGLNLVAGAQYNTFLGYEAGKSGSGTTNAADNNTAIGYRSLYSNTTGSENTASGINSLYYNTTGRSNVANGEESLYFNTTGSFNVANGSYSLHSNTIGWENAANGDNSLYSNTTGDGNTANGSASLFLNTIGSYNTANGEYSLYSNTDGTYNIGLGYEAGMYISGGVIDNTTGDYNIFIGGETKALADNDQNEIVIGYDTTGNGSDTTTIGNTSTLRTYLTGLNLKAGTATAGTSPLKFTSGTNLGTGEAGAMEYDGTNLYFTPTGTTRKTVAYTSDLSNMVYPASGIAVSNGSAWGTSITDNSTDWNNALPSSSFSDTGVTSKLLTGFVSGSGVVADTDTILQAIQKLNGNIAASGSGTVTSVSVTTANGVSGSVANPTTTPAITLTLGAITPTSVNGLPLSQNNTTFNITVGQDAGLNLLSNEIHNTFLGYESGKGIAASDGFGFKSSNTAIGYQSLYSSTVGGLNTAVGAGALYSSQGVGSNTAMGYNSMHYANNQSGFGAGYNTAVGYSSLMGSNIASDNTGVSNTAMGSSAMINNTSGSQNAAFGKSALAFNLSGFNNVALGSSSLFYNTAGSYNVGVGGDSLGSNIIGNNNTAVGYKSGTFSVTGTNYNTNGDFFNETSNNSIYLGYDTRASADGNTNEIVVGYGTVGNGSDTTTIGNDSTLRTYLTGLNLKAGDSTAGTAPLKFTSSAGTVLGTTEAGAVEYDGSHLYFTATNSGPRYQLDQQVGSGSMVYPSAGIAVSTGSGWDTSITDNSTNWNTAFSQTRQWDGGSTGLVAATGRTSLELGSAALSDTGDFATSAQGTLATNALPSSSFSDAGVTSKLLTGYVSGSGIVANTDTILQGFQKLNGNITNKVSSQWTTTGSDIYYNDGRAFIGATSEGVSSSKLYIAGTTSGNGATSAIAGILGAYTFTSAGGVQVGNRFVVTNSPSVANTSIGEIVRTVDNTSLANLVRGLEVTSNAGSNTAGVNTGIRTTGGTFGLQALTTGLSGGDLTPAAIYGESTATTQPGDVLRLYSNTMTSATSFATFYHKTSAYTGTGLLMDFAEGSGTFSGNFVDFQKNNNSLFKVTNGGVLTMGLSATAATSAVCSSLANGTAPTADVAYEIRDCSNTPVADYAEMYPVEKDVSYGDIVAIKEAIPENMVNTYDVDANGVIDWNNVKSSITKLEKTSKGYQGNVVGVVSNNYSDFSTVGYNIKPEDNPMPIAMNGRVPVKIASTSESIKAGDYLTTSPDESGKAMKALSSGFAIGKALEDWDKDGGKETIMFFVEQGYHDNTIELDGLTYLNANKEFIESIKFNDVVEFAVPPLFNNDTAGFAIIKAGTNKVDVVFDTPYISQPIISSTVSFEDTEGNNMTDEEAQKFFDEGIQTIVTNKTQYGFTIRINKIATDDILFSWIALQVRDPKIFESVVDGLVIEPDATVVLDTTTESPTENKPTTETAPNSDTVDNTVALPGGDNLEIIKIAPGPDEKNIVEEPKADTLKEVITSEPEVDTTPAQESKVDSEPSVSLELEVSQ